MTRMHIISACTTHQEPRSQEWHRWESHERKNQKSTKLQNVLVAVLCDALLGYNIICGLRLVNRRYKSVVLISEFSVPTFLAWWCNACMTCSKVVVETQIGGFPVSVTPSFLGMSHLVVISMPTNGWSLMAASLNLLYLKRALEKSRVLKWWDIQRLVKWNFVLL